MQTSPVFGAFYFGTPGSVNPNFGQTQHLGERYHRGHTCVDLFVTSRAAGRANPSLFEQLVLHLLHFLVGVFGHVPVGVRVVGHLLC